MAGCSSSPHASEYPLLDPYYSANENAFEYKLPQGWMDASGTDTTNTYALWLVRHDYNASMVIDEIELDEASRQELLNGGVEAISGLVGSLYDGGGSKAEEVEIGSIHGIAFEQDQGSSEYKSRVVVFARGDRLFESTAMAKAGMENESFGVQKAVLEAIRW